jgi:hypothetical protein
MQPTTSNMFYTNLAVHQYSLTARTSTGMANRGVESQRCSPTASCCGTRGMEASSWGVISPELWRVLLGGNA